MTTKDFVIGIAVILAILGTIATAAYIGSRRAPEHPCTGWESATVLDAPAADAGTHRAFACVEWKP
jgi:hypothetical protein